MLRYYARWCYILQVQFERDERLLATLDRILVYLRVVHSIDYYNHTDYPHEDQMPNRFAKTIDIILMAYHLCDIALQSGPGSCARSASFAQGGERQRAEWRTDVVAVV